MRNRPGLLWAIVLGVGLAVCAALPLYSTNISFMFYLLFWTTVACGFNLIYGFTGYLPFGYVAFYGIGSYVAAIVALKANVPLPLAVVVAGLAAVPTALLFFPTLRLRGVYFAVVNFAIALALRSLIGNLPDSWAGGSTGLHLTRFYNPQLTYYLMLTLTAVVLVLVWHVSRSRLGTALRAVKQDPLAAEVVGIDSTRARLFAWVLAAVIPAMAGALDAFFTAVIDPTTAFHPQFTAKSVLFPMFGGLGTVIGPVVGTLIMYVVDDWIWSHFPFFDVFLLGLVLVLLILFLPRGVVGELLRRYPKLRSYVR